LRLTTGVEARAWRLRQMQVLLWKVQGLRLRRSPVGSRRRAACCAGTPVNQLSLLLAVVLVVALMVALMVPIEVPVVVMVAVPPMVVRDVAAIAIPVAVKVALSIMMR
jgi:hypothetical protein